MTLSINNITFIIVTFKSEHIIGECIESLPKNSKIIVIENSNNSDLKKNLEDKYSKTNKKARLVHISNYYFYLYIMICLYLVLFK